MEPIAIDDWTTIHYLKLRNTIYCAGFLQFKTAEKYCAKLNSQRTILDKLLGRQWKIRNIVLKL